LYRVLWVYGYLQNKHNGCDGEYWAAEATEYDSILSKCGQVSQNTQDIQDTNDMAPGFGL